VKTETVVDWQRRRFRYVSQEAARRHGDVASFFLRARWVMQSKGDVRCLDAGAAARFLWREFLACGE
jgi:hypothetical protein